MTLHDWIDEACALLGLDHDVDEALVLDLARVCAHGVERPAAPVTTYLLGYAAAAGRLDAQGIEERADRLTALAERWDTPDAEVASDATDAASPDGDVDVPDADLAIAVGDAEGDSQQH
ncbi:MAG: DUF6457 domain-containing protein [Nocardioides sp.]|nr:DUF6457 domain-containing protein [Nocardioides sp.]